MLAQTGFRDVRLTQRFNSFEGTSKERIARKYGVRGANFFARR